MQKINRIHRYFVIIAVLAIMMSALSPSISGFISAANDNAKWVEVCSLVGLKVIKIDGNTQLPIKEKHTEFCSYCLHQNDFVGFISVNNLTVPIKLINQQFPPLFYLSPSPLFSWATPQSRAPPARI